MKTLEVLEVEEIQTRAVQILQERIPFALLLTEDLSVADAVRTLALSLPYDEVAQEEWFEHMRGILDLADVSRQEIASQFLAALLMNRAFSRGSRRFKIAQYSGQN